MLRSKLYKHKLSHMHRMKNLLVGLLIAGLPASAQQTLTLEQAIATALQNNYDIQLSRNDSMVAALDYTYRNAVFLPRINANAANQWNKNNQKQEFFGCDEKQGR